MYVVHAQQIRGASAFQELSIRKKGNQREAYNFRTPTLDTHKHTCRHFINLHKIYTPIYEQKNHIKYLHSGT